MTDPSASTEDKQTFHRRTPCGNCPFRKSAPLAYWHPSMYQVLESMEAVEGDIFRSSGFACHKDRHLKKPELCIGWLLDQRRKDVPSLALRMILSRSKDAQAQLQESEADGDLYDCVSELVSANLREDAVLFPERYCDEEDTP